MKKIIATGGRTTPDHCNHCDKHCTKEGHDACLGTLPGNIMNACCGHGESKEAYIQYHDGKDVNVQIKRIAGKEALEEIKKLTNL